MLRWPGGIPRREEELRVDAGSSCDTGEVLTGVAPVVVLAPWMGSSAQCPCNEHLRSQDRTFATERLRSLEQAGKGRYEIMGHLDDSSRWLAPAIRVTRGSGRQPRGRGARAGQTRRTPSATAGGQAAIQWPSGTSRR